jgi:hypothetical protein
MRAEGDDGLTVDDPLLSIDDIARLWQTDSATIASLVEDGTIPALDGGAMVRRGRYDVPLTRLSWAEATRVNSPGASRRIDDDAGEGIHPAASIAYALHIALQDRDATAVWELSSRSSHELCGEPQPLLNGWRQALGTNALSSETSMTSGVYRLDPHPGVGVRLIAVSPPVPQIIVKPTPMPMAGLIPLVREEEGWRADLPLARLDVNWSELLQTAVTAEK